MSSLSTSSRFSPSMNRTLQWVFSQEIPTDVVVQVGDARFPLHKFLLVSKSGYLRRKIVESDPPDISAINLSDIPGGPDAFERAAKFCYSVNFEISIKNVVTLRCAAEYLEMTDEIYPENLIGRTEDFLAQAAFKSIPGALAVLRSCDGLLPLADKIGIVQHCIDVIALKACVEANFTTRSPPDWWAAELANSSPANFQKILVAMKTRNAAPKTLVTAVVTYIEKTLPGLIRLPGAALAPKSPPTNDSLPHQCSLLESITALLPVNRDAPLPVGFLCCLLRAAIHLNCSPATRRQLEKRISSDLDQVEVGDLLTVALDYNGERVVDLDSVRRIVLGFVEKEMGGGVGGSGGGELYGGDTTCSMATQKVARTVDTFIGEIATDVDLGVSKFAGIAGALPKSARRFDDDIYRAVDIYLKIHPELDEIEREKVCSVMDPLKLSYEARLHASQNKRLPLQVVLHALYYDQLKVRSGSVQEEEPVKAVVVRGRAAADATLMKENEELRSELTRMKMYMTDMQRGQGGSGSKGVKKATFLSSVSRTLGKLIGRAGSKDTSTIEDGGALVSVAKPKRRRFSIS